MKHNFGPIQLFILMGLLITHPGTPAHCRRPGHEFGERNLRRWSLRRMPLRLMQRQRIGSHGCQVCGKLAGMKALEGGSAEKAISFFNLAAERDALTSSGWLALGSAYQEQGKTSEAILAWKHALPLARADSYPGSCRTFRGKFRKAIDYWRANIALEPESGAAHYSLGLLLAATCARKSQSRIDQGGRSCVLPLKPRFKACERP